MKYTTIRIEGSILSADILDKIEQGELGGQRPDDFGFSSQTKVKDEIAKAWADAHDLWRIFSRQREKISGSGTTETRKYWILPLLGILGYDAENAHSEEINGKGYAISHRVKNLDGFAIHIMGCNDSLDKRREDSGPRMSPHALVQEYLNITEHLYAIVTNGIYLRLLRDSSRLVKLSFIEYDLKAMMEEEQFADFAIMYRLLHASRMPVKIDSGAESLIEKYHQDALDSGSRIREGLSDAVELSIKEFAEGFLNHPSNNKLREAFLNNKISDFEFYQWHLRLIYRLLFLMVIEERNLIYPKSSDAKKVSTYYNYYSVAQLRNKSEKILSVEKGYSDFWLSLKRTFKIFESEYYGKTLDIKPLAGDLFSFNAIGMLNECNLDNKVVLECLRNLTVFINKNNNQKTRVNYASLNVEEFGSVYEGLLEYDPLIEKTNGNWHFVFKKGEGRSSSGSHYTPEELVQPLIKHSLEYVIGEKLNDTDKEKALLSIKVADIACGSGHILLSAARRIAVELARVRTCEDQPSPDAFRQAVRDVIRNCIYGVDKNPLAVELCKVALWLEAHNPGEPLNFLDHRVKCGDSIVGVLKKEDLNKGISEDAFKRLPADNKDVCAELRKRNSDEKKSGVDFLQTGGVIDHKIKQLCDSLKEFEKLPEKTPEQVEQKSKAYKQFSTSQDWWNLKVLSDIKIAQFFIPKTPENKELIITDGQYWLYQTGRQMIGPAVGKAMDTSGNKKFFHWFLEFPEVFASGGFDCILGNPPFLGNRGLRGAFGIEYLNYLTVAYAPSGAIDLVGYFFRRAFSLIRFSGFQALISTNTISQGGTREGALDIIEKSDGSINFAIRSVRWPGVAAVNVSLVSIHKGKWRKDRFLDNKTCSYISTYLDDAQSMGNPFPLKANESKSFQGSIVLGKGFILEPEEALALIEKNPKNKNVLFPYLNGDDLNSRPDQTPSRWVINFFDWPIEKAMQYEDCFRIVETKIKPERQRWKEDSSGKPIIGEYALRKPLPQKWWIYADKRPELYRTIAGMKRVLVITRVTKYCCFSFIDLINPITFSEQTVVITSDEYVIFALLQSSVHEIWAWKYASTMGASTLRYSPSDVFETYPMPINCPQELIDISKAYLNQRNEFLIDKQIGLTKFYNLFHNKNSVECASVKNMREVHKDLDNAILIAYGWTDIDLRHDFYEVDYLPENDRIRFTIHPDARREILKRLLMLNHERHAEEIAEGLIDEKGKPLKKKTVTPKEKISNSVSIDVKQEELPIFVPGEIRQGDIFDDFFPRSGTIEEIAQEIIPHFVNSYPGKPKPFFKYALKLLRNPDDCLNILKKTDVDISLAARLLETEKKNLSKNIKTEEVRWNLLWDLLLSNSLINISNNNLFPGKNYNESENKYMDIINLIGIAARKVEETIESESVLKDENIEETDTQKTA